MYLIYDFLKQYRLIWKEGWWSLQPFFLVYINILETKGSVYVQCIKKQNIKNFKPKYLDIFLYLIQDYGQKYRICNLKVVDQSPLSVLTWEASSNVYIHVYIITSVLRLSTFWDFWLYKKSIYLQGWCWYKLRTPEFIITECFVQKPFLAEGLDLDHSKEKLSIRAKLKLTTTTLSCGR